MPCLTITLDGEFDLQFAIEKTPLADLWLEKMSKRHQWPLDDDRRFYGFDDQESARASAERRLKQCVDVINGHRPIIERSWQGIDDQDYLNYLHHIFERYHGLLDQQNTEWWYDCPDTVKKALANLNIAVHRAETVTRGNLPRLVCTWFGMPKDTVLDPNLMCMYGKISYEFGGVYLNYVEIGKTLEDLTIDCDQWISPDAFQPFLRYSADFCVRFYDAVPDLQAMYKYFLINKEFFSSRGINSFDDYRIIPRRYKVAQLQTELDRQSVISTIAAHQRVTAVAIA